MTFKTARLGLFAALALVVVGFGSSGATAAALRIAALGDSLTAGYGLDPGQSFPEQLEAALRERGRNVEVTNAGVSGDTAADGLARLDWSVPAEAKIVIVELGANDMLRGIDPAITRGVLGKIIRRLQARGQRVLLAGMLATPNMGETYQRQFAGMYKDLAREFRVPLYPFFLDGVAGVPGMQLADGEHPTAAGVAAIVKRILPDVEAAIAAASKAS